MKKTLTILAGFAVTFAMAGITNADFADFNHKGNSGTVSDNTDVFDILNHYYGSWTRVDDFLPNTGNTGDTAYYGYADGGTPGANLNVCSGYAGQYRDSTLVTDQVWDDGITNGIARARFAGYTQKFGYTTDSGSSWTQLFSVSGTGYGVSGSALVDLSGLTWAWVRAGTGATVYSEDALNQDGFGHMLTYQILTDKAGNSMKYKTWMVFWEDIDKIGDPTGYSKYVDWDYNDLAVEITCIPVPGAVILGLLGLTAAGVKLRRFA